MAHGKARGKAKKLTTFQAMTAGSKRTGGSSRSGTGVKAVAPKRTANPLVQASKLGLPPSKVKKGKKKY